MDILLVSHPFITPLNLHKEWFHLDLNISLLLVTTSPIQQQTKPKVRDRERKLEEKRPRLTRFSELNHTLYNKQEDNDNLSKWKCPSQLIAKGNHGNSHCAAELIQSFTFVSFVCKF